MEEEWRRQDTGSAASGAETIQPGQDRLSRAIFPSSQQDCGTDFRQDFDGHSALDISKKLVEMVEGGDQKRHHVRVLVQALHRTLIGNGQLLDRDSTGVLDRCQLIRPLPIDEVRYDTLFPQNLMKLAEETARPSVSAEFVQYAQAQTFADTVQGDTWTASGHANSSGPATPYQSCFATTSVAAMGPVSERDKSTNY
eukprot:CAMPEP_0173058986 /NCGR_PEP_ID=MMETSP1102-20130122/1684_1 /TAXON_ID=49646 /ORGANISM="Geminigera sp., Strain Caron Lab Isolate" /LENGTH=196 /DNA_ID=CAMNT_0013924841 /DNA_START=129 /DNA_END=716 /DNA_ORIENTATION=-